MLVLFFLLRPYPSISGGREDGLFIASDGEFSIVKRERKKKGKKQKKLRTRSTSRLDRKIAAVVVFCLVPASLSHFSSRGLSLHMFLKLRFRASKREMVVWLKSFP